MARKRTQISVEVSSLTKELLEQASKRSGVKKGRLVEDAIQYHLRALEALPPDVMVPPVITLSNESFDRMLELIENPPEPTPAMRELFDQPREDVVFKVADPNASDD